MLIAVISVSLLIAITLGLRESLIVFLAIPVTLALTLAVFYLYGYTLNRITLFALIFSIGILVDDAIVVVENIVRHWRMPANRDPPAVRSGHRGRRRGGQPHHSGDPHRGRRYPADGVCGRVDGAVHAADPHRRQRRDGLLAAGGVDRDALGRGAHSEAFGRRDRTGSGRIWSPGSTAASWAQSCTDAPLRWGFLAGVVFLLLGSVSLFYFQFVKVKMLPFDNKSEFQVIVDMPNGTTLEETARVAGALARAALDQPEVVNLQTYVGTASPFNFNGLVRHYYLRRGSNVADIQVNLLGKGDRKLQSHEIAKQVRQRLLPVADRFGARIKVAEVPPGPPVLQTLVAEVYGPAQEGRIGIARQIRDLWKRTDGVVDVDWYVEDDQPKYRLVVDKEKAALNGISEDEIARTMQVASAGYQAGLLHVDSAKEDVPLMVRLDRASRSDMERIQNLKLAGRTGRLVALSELVKAEHGHRRQEHLSQEPHAGDLCDRRCGRRDGKPGLRHPQTGTGNGQVPSARRICDRAAHGGAAHRFRPLLDEMGWRVAHHLRGVPRPGDRLCGGAHPDLRAGGGMVPVVRDAAHHHGGDSVFAGGNSAGARAAATPFSRPPR